MLGNRIMLLPRYRVNLGWGVTAGNPQIYRVWPPKNLPKIQICNLRKAGAAALGLHPKKFAFRF